MLILHNINASTSFEIPWIYDRGPHGLFLKIENGKGRVSVGDKVSIGYYNPSLDKEITTFVSKIETNSLNNNICIAVRNKKGIQYFKKNLINYEI